MLNVNGVAISTGGGGGGLTEVLVGKTIFVSSVGSALGQIEHLENHFDNLTDAIAAITSSNDLIEVYPGV